MLSIAERPRARIPVADRRRSRRSPAVPIPADQHERVAGHAARIEALEAAAGRKFFHSYASTHAMPRAVEAIDRPGHVVGRWGNIRAAAKFVLRCRATQSTEVASVASTIRTAMRRHRRAFGLQWQPAQVGGAA